MDALKLRSQHDIELFEQLLKDPDVVRVNNHIEKQEEKGNLGVRRRLLSTSVRLSPAMARDLHATAEACRERLNMEILI